MSFINKISGGVLVELAKSSGQKASSAKSSINGRGLGATSDRDNVDLASGLRIGAEAFARSYVRFNEAIGLVRTSKNLLSELEDITHDLLDLAEESAASDATQADRNSLNLRYQGLVRDARAVIELADGETYDAFSKSDISEVLKDAGVDLNAATALSLSLDRSGGADGILGVEYIDVEPLAEAVEGEVALQDVSSRDPLNSDIKTRTTALLAVQSLSAYMAELENDLEAMSFVEREIQATINFSLASTSIFESSSSRIDSFPDAEKLAQDIVKRIRNATNDPSLAAHSDLDTILVQEILDS